ncbi:MAG: hypothetical protein K1X47_04695 [Cyclobacteriaceae bacterium]|nr:hypothetical protein [Cyclobacteriaceae bacterium]
MNRYYWTGVAHGQRSEALQQVREIAGRHAAIVQFQFFSDMAFGLVLEVDAGHTLNLYTELAAVLTLEPAAPATADECIVMLNVTFISTH